MDKPLQIGEYTQICRKLRAFSVGVGVWAPMCVQPAVTISYMRNTARVTVRCTQEELAGWHQQAARMGVTLSVLVRTLMNDLTGQNPAGRQLHNATQTQLQAQRRPGRSQLATAVVLFLAFALVTAAALDRIIDLSQLVAR